MLKKVMPKAMSVLFCLFMLAVLLPASAAPASAAEAGINAEEITLYCMNSSYYYSMTAAKDGRKVYCVITDSYGNSVKSNTVILSMD